MPPQPPISSFTLEIRTSFKKYLENKIELGKTLMNATECVKYLQYLANPEQKIYKIDKVEKKHLNATKREVIKDYCIDCCR